MKPSGSPVVRNRLCQQIFHQRHREVSTNLVLPVEQQDWSVRCRKQAAPALKSMWLQSALNFAQRRRMGTPVVSAVDLTGARATTSVHPNATSLLRFALAFHLRRCTLSSSCPSHPPQKNERNRAVVHSCVADHPPPSMTPSTW